ncbi:hypothetical protein CMV_020841, partial [Castanea mollissima]
KFRSCKERKL